LRVELRQVDHERQTLRIRDRRVNRIVGWRGSECYARSVDRYDALVAELREEIPGFRVVRKDRSALNRVIHGLLYAITFGRMRTYLTDYQTTIGRTVYVTPDFDTWDADRRYVTLRHEAVHLRQFRKYTLPGMSFLYLLVPLPVGLAWFRAHFEREAYAESIRAAAEVWGSAHPRQPAYRAHVVAQFLGSAYGWMWPFRRQIERWYDQILATIVDNR
jgi:hypothetical protein